MLVFLSQKRSRYWKGLLKKSKSGIQLLRMCCKEVPTFITNKHVPNVFCFFGDSLINTTNQCLYDLYN